jgi:hypothetical protein
MSPALLREVAETMLEVLGVVGHEHEYERKTSARKSTPSQASRPRSEGGSGDGSVNVEPGPMTEEVRVYLILF